MRSTRTALLILLSCVTHASGQTVTGAQVAPDSTPPRAASVETRWSFSAAVYTYLLPDEGNYAQPTFVVNRGWFHVEARYNYEEMETGSVWAGYNFGGGTTVAWEITPMVGGVFGSSKGVASGYTGSLSWWKMDLYSEGEYVFDTAQSSNSFFYNWSELALVSVERFRFGLVAQRTRVYETDRELQRGLFVGVGYGSLEATTYVFNPDDGEPTVVVAISLSF
jgi:hypothetical protein